MTFEEYQALLQNGSPFSTFTPNPDYVPGFNSPGTTQTMTGVRMIDPNNPLAGFVMDAPGGGIRVYIPRDTQTGRGGTDATTYDAQGNVVSRDYLTSGDWNDSLRQAVMVLGGAAVAGNLGQFLPGAGAGPTGGTAAGATGGTAAGATAGATGGAGGAAAAGTAAAAPTAGAMTGGLGGATFGAGSLPTTIGMGGVGAGMIGLPSIADGTLSAGDILNDGAGYIGGGGPSFSVGVPGAPSLPGGPSAPSGSAPSGSAPTMPSGMMDWVRQNAPWLIPALGAGAAIAGNDDITQTQTTSGSGTQGLAPWLDTYARDFVGRAQELSTAPASNATMDAGRGLLTDYATQGDPLVNAARAQQQNVIGGGLLNANPHIDQVAQNIGNRMGDAYAVGTRANTATRFNNDGNSVGAKSAYGQTNFMNDRAFGDALGSTMSNLYFGNYQQERAAQDAASRGSLGFGTFASGNAQNAYNVGAQDWMRPFMQNQQFGQAINPAFGSQTSTSGTQNQTITAPNNWMAGLGGAAMGAGIWNMFNPQRRA